jgi:hypothetical protein
MIETCANCEPRAAHSCAYLKSRLRALGEDSSTVHRQYCTGLLSETEYDSIRKSLRLGWREIRLLLDECRRNAACPELILD